MSRTPFRQLMGRRQAGYLVSGAIIIIVGTIVLAAWMLLESRRDAWNDALRTSGNLATAFERDISRNIELYDLSLKSAIANSKLPDVWAFAPELRNQILFGGATNAPYLGTMRLLDANGHIVAESGKVDPAGLEFSDRDYFQIHRNHPDIGLFVSAPLKGRETGEWMVAFSRRIDGPDGTFAGIAVGTMRLAYFEQLFGSVDPGLDGTIALIRNDGTYLVREPFKEEFIGRSLDAMESGWMRDSAGQGTREGISRIDGVHRLYAYRQIGDQPLAVRVGLSTASIFADWRQKALIVAFAVSMLLVVVAVLGALFVIESRRRMEAERLVAASEQQMQQAQQMEAVGRLAGGIAHDFNNILSSILGFAGFLIEDLPAGSQELSFAERIVKAAERAKGLVRQILTFSRRSILERVPLDLVAIVFETRDLLRATLPASTRLDINVSAGSFVIDANAVQISQILLNLCVNANDALAGREGVISLSVSRIDPARADIALLLGAKPRAGHQRPARAGKHVSGALEPGRSYVELTVTDGGVGMEAEVLSHVFDPFFTTKEVGRGTGLGLSVVEGIVLEHRGACLVTSSPGTGTAFRVYLPLSDKPIAAETAPVARQRGQERILVVDDEADVAEALAIGLGRRGYQAVAATKPEEAFESFAQDPAAWDAVVSDQVMPGLKGLALFARIRATGSDVPFVLCTGFSDGASEDVALACGVDAYFLKPAPVDQIASAIRRLLDDPAARRR